MGHWSVRLAGRRVWLVSLVMLLAACDATVTPPAEPSSGRGVLTVVFLDVGQGDATLVRAPSGMTLLIDGGGAAESATGVILPKLREWGAARLDLMVVTHPDADHIGGLPTVLESIPVAEVALTGQVHSSAIYERLLTDIRDRQVHAIRVRTGAALPFDPNVDLAVLSPDDRFVEAGGDSNNASIVIRLAYGEVSFLFTGDVEADGEQAMLASGARLASTVLKVAHHGSRYSTGEAFLDAVAPRIGVISVGADNTFGHPNPDTLERLARHNVTVYRTDRQGTITVTTDGTTFEIKTEKQR